MRFELRLHGRRVAALEAGMADLRQQLAAIHQIAGLFYDAGHADAAAGLGRQPAPRMPRKPRAGNLALVRDRQPGEGES